jgi:hypothetical protein
VVFTVNAMPHAATRPLLDLLGARFRVPVPATAAAWDAGGGTAAFGFADGSVALVAAQWEGAPTVRARPGGGVELVPGTGGKPPEIAHRAVHDGACRTIAANPDGGFLTGGEDAMVARLPAGGGEATVLVPAADGGPALVAAGRGGWRVAAIGNRVQRLGGGGVAIAGQATAVAVDPTGARVAIAHAGGVTVWAGGETPRVLSAPGTCRDLAWSGDAGWLAGATAEGEVHAWLMPAGTTLTLKADGPAGALASLGSALVAGVGGRVICWHIVTASTAAPVPCGASSQAAVTRLAGHPGRMLIAAGYANGAVALCRPGDPGLLLVRGAGEGAVSVLAFAPSAALGGAVLATGTAGGEIAVLPVPDTLFRESAGPQ